MTAATPNRDRLVVFALPLDLDVLELSFAAKKFDEAVEVGRISEDVGAEIFFDQFARLGVLQHAFERGVYTEKLAVNGGAVNAIGRALHKRAEACFGLAQRFGGLFTVGHVTTDDDEFLSHTLRAENDTGSRFENTPRAVFMKNAVFEGLPLSRAARFGTGFLHIRAIFRVDLLKARGVFKFFGRVAQSSFVGDAVVDAIAVHIDDGDEVGGVFADEPEELFALEQLATDAVDLKLLEDGVEVEKEYEADQAPDGLLEFEEGFPCFAGVQEGRKK